MKHLKWMDDAECDGMDTELWFPIGQEEPDPVALATCQRCPVSDECLNYSLRGPGEQILCGYWAGMSEDERRNEKRNRNRRAERVA